MTIENIRRCGGKQNEFNKRQFDLDNEIKILVEKDSEALLIFQH